MLIDELLAYLFDGQAHPLTTEVATWLTSSRRFTTFVSNSRDKIRKKLRSIREQESLYDLRLELETAYLLLREPSLSVAYEPQLGQVRYPDFEVTFTTSLTFTLEVTRMRATQKQVSMQERIADTICSKLGQLQPQRSNILVIGLDGPSPTHNDIHAAMIGLQQRVEQNDPAVLKQHRFRDRAEFFRHYQRLSEILVRGTRLTADDPSVVWVNPQARHPLPSRVRTALHHSHTLQL